MNIRDRKIKSAGALLRARFDAKVKIVASGCHEWQGCLQSRGYGQIRFDGASHYAHRLAWEMANGKTAGKMYVLHRCDNPKCVNSEHLFIGSQADNLADMRAKGRRNHRRKYFTLEEKRNAKIAAQREWKRRRKIAAQAPNIGG